MRYKILFYFGLIVISILAIILLFPTYWTITGALRVKAQNIAVPPQIFPSRTTLANFSKILTDSPFFRWVLNTLIVAAGGTFFGVSLACLSGYAFAKKKFFGKEVLFWTAMATMMIPFYVMVIPLYIFMRQIGLYNTHLGLFLPGLGGAGSMFLARQYISTIPSEFIDSAKVDGASELQVFLRIIVPLSKPLIAVLSIFGFVGAWRNYFWPLVMTSDNSARTVAVGIAHLAARRGDIIDIGIAMAGASLVMIPIYIVFISFQKYFTKGITLGGVKG